MKPFQESWRRVSDLQSDFFVEAAELGPEIGSAFAGNRLTTGRVGARACRAAWRRTDLQVSRLARQLRRFGDQSWAVTVSSPHQLVINAGVPAASNNDSI